MPKPGHLGATAVPVWSHAFKGLRYTCTSKNEYGTDDLEADVMAAPAVSPMLTAVADALEEHLKLQESSAKSSGSDNNSAQVLSQTWPHADMQQESLRRSRSAWLASGQQQGGSGAAHGSNAEQQECRGFKSVPGSFAFARGPAATTANGVFVTLPVSPESPSSSSDEEATLNSSIVSSIKNPYADEEEEHCILPIPRKGKFSASVTPEQAYTPPTSSAPPTSSMPPAIPAYHYTRSASALSGSAKDALGLAKAASNAVRASRGMTQGMVMKKASVPSASELAVGEMCLRGKGSRDLRQMRSHSHKEREGSSHGSRCSSRDDSRFRANKHGPVGGGDVNSDSRRPRDLLIDVVATQVQVQRSYLAREEHLMSAGAEIYAPKLRCRGDFMDAAGMVHDSHLHRTRSSAYEASVVVEVPTQAVGGRGAERKLTRASKGGIKCSSVPTRQLEAVGGLELEAQAMAVCYGMPVPLPPLRQGGSTKAPRAQPAMHWYESSPSGAVDHLVTSGCPSGESWKANGAAARRPRLNPSAMPSGIAWDICPEAAQHASVYLQKPVKQSELFKQSDGEDADNEDEDGTILDASPVYTPPGRSGPRLDEQGLHRSAAHGKTTGAILPPYAKAKHSCSSNHADRSVHRTVSSVMPMSGRLEQAAECEDIRMHTLKDWADYAAWSPNQKMRNPTCNNKVPASGSMRNSYAASQDYASSRNWEGQRGAPLQASVSFGRVDVSYSHNFSAGSAQGFSGGAHAAPQLGHVAGLLAFRPVASSGPLSLHCPAAPAPSAGRGDACSGFSASVPTIRHARSLSPSQTWKRNLTVQIENSALDTPKSVPKPIAVGPPPKHRKQG